MSRLSIVGEAKRDSVTFAELDSVKSPLLQSLHKLYSSRHAGKSKALIVYCAFIQHLFVRFRNLF